MLSKWGFANDDLTDRRGDERTDLAKFKKVSDELSTAMNERLAMKMYLIPYSECRRNDLRGWAYDVMIWINSFNACSPENMFGVNPKKIWWL